MVEKLSNPTVIISFLCGLKLLLIPFGFDVFSTEQADAIANGISALVIVIIGIIAKINEAQAKAELAELQLQFAKLGGKNSPF